MRSIALLLMAATASVAFGEDTDEVRSLKLQVKELEGKLTLAEKEIQLLKKEIDLKSTTSPKLKSGQKPGNAQSLSDLCVPGAVMRGDFRRSVPDLETGEWTLRIRDRDGKKFTGVVTIKMTEVKGDPVEGDVTGEIVGDRIKFIVDTAKLTATVTGALRKDILTMDWNGRLAKAELKGKIER